MSSLTIVGFGLYAMFHGVRGLAGQELLGSLGMIAGGLLVVVSVLAT